MPKPKRAKPKPAKGQEGKLNAKQFWMLRHANSILAIYGYLSDSQSRRIRDRLDDDVDLNQQALKPLSGKGKEAGECKHKNVKHSDYLGHGEWREACVDCGKSW